MFDFVIGVIRTVIAVVLFLVTVEVGQQSFGYSEVKAVGCALMLWLPLGVGVVYKRGE